MTRLLSPTATNIKAWGGKSVSDWNLRIGSETVPDPEGIEHSIVAVAPRQRSGRSFVTQPRVPPMRLHPGL